MPSRIRTFQELEQTARSLPPATVAVAGAADPEVLQGALQAARTGLARLLLVGDEARLRAMLQEAGAANDERLVVVHAAEDAICAKAVELCASGAATILLKGMVSTGALLRAALSSEAGLKEPGALLSDVLVCPNPFRAGRPLWGISDGGVNVAPTLEHKARILANGLAVMRALGIAEPRAALLCASEKADKSMPATLEAKELAERAAAGAFGPAVVEGPLSMDVAVSAESAAHKGVSSRVAGVADLLVAPSIEAGNLMAKTLYLARGLPVAHVIAGIRVPVLINSRNDTAEDRVRSIVLAMVVAARSGAQPQAPAESATVLREAAPAAAAADHGILAINPGATSTKIALFAGAREVWREDLAHDAQSFAGAASIQDQLDARVRGVTELLERRGVRGGGAPGIAAVVGRGGLLPPLPGGTWRIDERMIEDLRRAARGEHASNLGAPMAARLASMLGAQSFIVDPVAVDELRDEARLTGWPGLVRDSLSHALNLRAVARRVAAKLGEPLAHLRLVGIHLGTGISMAAFERGRMVDIVNPRDEGPLSADRAGSLPGTALAKLVIREKWTEADVERRLGREGGLQALVGTRDLREVRRRAQAGDEKCAQALDAMVLGIAKNAFGLLASLDELPDRFFVTGGMAHDAALAQALTARLERVAPVDVVPGEDELPSLAQGALRALTGAEAARDYAAFMRTAHA